MQGNPEIQAVLGDLVFIGGTLKCSASVADQKGFKRLCIFISGSSLLNIAGMEKLHMQKTERKGEKMQSKALKKFQGTSKRVRSLIVFPPLMAHT